MSKDNQDDMRCSFCGKSGDEVERLIAGSTAFVCDICIRLCNDILEEEKHAPAGEEGDDEPKTEESYLPTPEKIKERLDQFVIGQDSAKKVLSVAVYNHYKRLYHFKGDELGVDLGKSNVLLIGPTGSGKTLLAETLAKVLNVPFAIADATTLTEAGYVGEDVEHIIQNLLQRCDYDVEKAKAGIIYIDEIDKISRKSDSRSLTRDVSGEGVQQALLKLMEGTVVNIAPQGGKKQLKQEYIQLDTSNILFVCGGAFVGLDKLIQERSEKSGIGFGAPVKSKDDQKAVTEVLKKTEPEDLIKYGLIPEFIGRLPVIVTLHELTEDVLVEILKTPKNALVKQYQALFNMEGAELSFNDSALHLIAKKALSRKTGARGLRSILENILLDTMYHLPALENVQKVLIDDGVINGQHDPVLTYHSPGSDDLEADKKEEAK